jgi:hypothetical protein
MNKNEKMLKAVLIIASVIIVIGVMFVLTAAEIAPIFQGLTRIKNILGRYIIVIATMATGIMLFSNAAAAVEKKKLRNGLTLGITVFSTVLTIPLVYVFAAIFGAEKGVIDPVGVIMKIDKICEGFRAWFGGGAFLYVIYVFMLILSIVFIAFPLVTGVLTLKGKALKIGKQENGKFGIGIGELPVIKRTNKIN